MKYKKLIFFCLLLFPIITYFFFILDGNMELGSDLTRSDWLAFSSGLLGYVGTVFLGIVAFNQNHKNNEFNKEIMVNDLKIKSVVSVVPQHMVVDFNQKKIAQNSKEKASYDMKFDFLVKIFSEIPLLDITNFEIDKIEIEIINDNNVIIPVELYKTKGLAETTFNCVLDDSYSDKSKECYSYKKSINLGTTTDSYKILKYKLQGKYSVENIFGMKITEKFYWCFEPKGESYEPLRAYGANKSFLWCAITKPKLSNCLVKLDKIESLNI